MKLRQALKNNDYEERLNELELLSLEKKEKSPKGGFLALYSYLKRSCSEEGVGQSGK